MSSPSRIQLLPLPDEQLSFLVEGQERLRWHAARRYPRPFFYPLNGPSGLSLVRMGHPADAGHDHHRAFWHGHQNIGGVNFWEERGGLQQVRQDHWLHYQDGNEEAGMAVRIGWYDAHNVRLLGEDFMAILRPLPGGETFLELQLTFTTPLAELTIGKTNFGFLGLRVAKSISSHFGSGRLVNSEGAKGEPALFAKPAAWVDYSGPIIGKKWEGVTWFDHPTNRGYPTAWHVRDDGWMSAAYCLREGFTLARNGTLTIRYALHAHGGDVDPHRAAELGKQFAAAKPWQLAPAERPYRWKLIRAE